MSSEKERRNFDIKKGDIFITRTSETIDELGMSCVALKDYPEATYNGFTKRLRPIDSSIIHPRFIGYYLRLPSFRAGFMAFSTMTTRASLRNEDLLSMEIMLPDLATQQKIAGILSAYDDLIENNQKQIQLLEEAAQRLYKEWFVDLRFPGHESTRIVDGVPEGWEVCCIEDIADINSLSLQEKCKFKFIDYIELGSVNKGRIIESTTYKFENAPGRAKRLACDGSIIWGMVRPNLRPYALVVKSNKNTVFSTGFSIITPKKLPFSYVYCFVTTDSFVQHLVNFTNGSTYPAIKPVHFKKSKILKPSQSIVNKFHKYAEPMFKKIYFLEEENRNLLEIKKRLLPKLMVR